MSATTQRGGPEEGDMAGCIFLHRWPKSQGPTLSPQYTEEHMRRSRVYVEMTPEQSVASACSVRKKSSGKMEANAQPSFFHHLL